MNLLDHVGSIWIYWIMLDLYESIGSCWIYMNLLDHVGSIWIYGLFHQHLGMTKTWLRHVTSPGPLAHAPGAKVRTHRAVVELGIGIGCWFQGDWWLNGTIDEWWLNDSMLIYTIIYTIYTIIIPLMVTKWWLNGIEISLTYPMVI